MNEDQFATFDETTSFEDFLAYVKEKDKEAQSRGDLSYKSRLAYIENNEDQLRENWVVFLKSWNAVAEEFKRMTETLIKAGAAAAPDVAVNPTLPDSEED